MAHYSCPSCGHVYAPAKFMLGHSMDCVECGERFVFPEAITEAEPLKIKEPEPIAKEIAKEEMDKFLGEANKRLRWRKYYYRWKWRAGICWHHIRTFWRYGWRLEAWYFIIGLVLGVLFGALFI